MNQPLVRKIVVHPGNAHRDEVLACGLAVASGRVDPLQTVVERKDPTAKELRDPEVLVLDVGMRHDPATNCFDHHQSGFRNDCALSLLAKATPFTASTTYHDVFSIQEWYQNTILLDTRGPTATAKKLGLEEFPFGLLSPFESVILCKFEREPTGMLPMLGEVVRKLFAEAGVKQTAFEMLEQYHRVGTVDVNNDSGGKTKLFYLFVPNYDKDQRYVSQWANHKKFEFAFSVTPDDRGDGWTLYRFADNPHLDFAKIDGHESITFAHGSGFIAKTRNKIEMKEVLRLVRASVV